MLVLGNLNQCRIRKLASNDALLSLLVKHQGHFLLGDLLTEFYLIEVRSLCDVLELLGIALKYFSFLLERQISHAQLHILANCLKFFHF